MGAIQRPTGRGYADLDTPPPFLELSRAELVGQHSGQTAPLVEKAVKAAQGGVMFIDEAYSLKQGPKDTYGQEAVDALIKEMEDKRDQVIVILAGYQKEMQDFFKSNPGFVSRVPFSFHFADYTCGELGSIGGMVLRKAQVEVDLGARPLMA